MAAPARTDSSAAAGNDTLTGGVDRLTGERGGDDLYGGAGRDVFVFARGDGRDRIHDFRQGQDRVEIGAGAKDIGDLDIRQNGDDVAIRFANLTIIVEDEAAGCAFGADDFIV